MGYYDLKRGLTDKEFFKEACRWADSENIGEAQVWWSVFQEIIVREIFFNNYCRLPGIGEFDIEVLKYGRNRQLIDNDSLQIMIQPEKRFPVFTPCDEFVNDINNVGITKAYRKRQLQKTPNRADIERQLRAEAIKAQKEGDFEKSSKLNEELKESKKKYQAEQREKRKQWTDAEKILNDEEKERQERLDEQMTTIKRDYPRGRPRKDEPKDPGRDRVPKKPKKGGRKGARYTKKPK